MNPFPADLQNLIDTAIADKAKAVRGVTDIATANSELEAARKKVDDLNQVELDASNQAAISEPAAINAFTQWLRDQGTAAAQSSSDPSPVPTPVPTPDPVPVPTDPTEAVE